jgi:hypothetical protein
MRGTNGAAGIKEDGHPELFLVSSVCGLHGRLPAKLWLAIQSLSQVMRNRLNSKGVDQGQDET